MLVIVSFLFVFRSVLFNLNNDPKVLPNGEEVVEYSLQYLNDKKLIKIGNALDCSGYTQMVFAHFSIYLPPSSKDQHNLVECTELKNMCPGDLVFFKINGKTISHVGIYICDNKFIHSPGRHDDVRIDSLSDYYWKKRFVCGGYFKNEIE